MDDDDRAPTDEELRELGIDPEENRDRKENPHELPDVLQGDDAELGELEDELREDIADR